MSKVRLSLALSLCVLLSACGVFKKGPSGPPTGMDIINRFVEVTGGTDALENLETFSAEGTFEMPAMGIAASLKIASGNESVRTEVDIPGMGKITSGLSDGVAWEVSIMTGPRILEGNEADAAARQADNTWYLHPEKYFSDVTYVGIELIDEVECERVDFVGHNGSKETQYYSAETHLLVRIDATQHMQMGEVESSTTISGYEDVDGIMIPTAMHVNAMGVEQVLTFTDVKINPALEDGLFDLPEEIVALQK